MDPELCSGPAAHDNSKNIPTTEFVYSRRELLLTIECRETLNEVPRPSLVQMCRPDSPVRLPMLGGSPNVGKAQRVFLGANPHHILGDNGHY